LFLKTQILPYAKLPSAVKKEVASENNTHFLVVSHTIVPAAGMTAGGEVTFMTLCVLEPTNVPPMLFALVVKVVREFALAVAAVKLAAMPVLSLSLSLIPLYIDHILLNISPP